MEQRRPEIQSLRLPVEIVMLILTTFRDNRKMLKTCTLFASCGSRAPDIIPPRFATYPTATATARDTFDIFESLCVMLGIFSRLRVLFHGIGSLSSPNFKSIIPLIRVFESLTESRLRRCMFPTQEELFSVLRASLPAHIGLFTMGQRYIIDWILGQKHISSITSLCFGGVVGPGDQRAACWVSTHGTRPLFEGNNECKKILDIKRSF